MDKQKMNYFQSKLIREKEKLLSLISEEYDSSNLLSTELSLVDNHPGDIGTEVFQIEQSKGFSNQLKNTLIEIDDSLKDINDGKYGFCSICGKRIDKNRLDLIPYLKNCIHCSKKDEIMIDTKRKDNFNEYKKGLYGIEDDENVGYDGEDIYQDVAEFNIVSNDLSYSTGDNIGIMDEADHGIVDEIEKISQEYYDESLD